SPTGVPRPRAPERRGSPPGLASTRREIRLKNQPGPRRLPTTVVPVILRRPRTGGPFGRPTRRKPRMGTSRITMRVLATLTLWGGFGLAAHAQLPALTVDKALEAKPRQPGVVVTTPAPAEAARHRVDPIPNPKQPGSNMGYVVRDAQNRPVRQFVSYDGKSFNIVAFYIDGQEAYREVFPPTGNEPHQFRWLGPNGGKWGLDKDKDGRIDEWVVISPEEASQELLQAVLTRDAKRLEALLPTKENLDSLGLPADRSGPMLERAKGAAKRLTDAADALKLGPNARWIHLELGIPQTTPADAFGGRDDLVVHKNGTILIQ